MRKGVIYSIFLFIIILGFNLFLYPSTLDEIWNYGFSYNILNGVLPYRDFNMVLTPLYSFIMTIPLFIFGNNILVFHIFNVFIIISCFLILYKLLGEKAWLCMIVFWAPFSILYPSYNLFLLLLFLILIYLEKMNKSDYLIGFILGLLILTKQTVGGLVLIPGLLYCLKDKKKFISRIIGCLIPCGIFLIYLIITKSFMSFLDLCLFGLFDFAGSNGNYNNLCFYIFLVITIITIIFIIKDKKNIYNYYALMFYSVSIPLFDAYHVQLQLIAFVLICLMNFNKKIPINCFVIFILVVLCISFAYYQNITFNSEYPNNINHFEYRLLSKNQIDFTNEVNTFIKKNKNYKYMFLDSNGYYFRIINDQHISYLDLINMGNWGYNGSDKLLKAIKKLPSNTMFFVCSSDLVGQRQIDRRAIKYVIKNGKKINSVGLYDVYVLEK